MRHKDKGKPSTGERNSTLTTKAWYFDGMTVAVAIIAVEFPNGRERKGFALPRSKRNGKGITSKLGMLELIDVGMNFICIHTLGIIPEADDQRFKGIIGDGIVVGIDDDFHLGIAGSGNFC